MQSYMQSDMQQGGQKVRTIVPRGMCWICAYTWEEGSSTTLYVLTLRFLIGRQSLNFNLEDLAML